LPFYRDLSYRKATLLLVASFVGNNSRNGHFGQKCEKPPRDHHRRSALPD
jgi:hypothetical protein